MTPSTPVAHARPLATLARLLLICLPCLLVGALAAVGAWSAWHPQTCTAVADGAGLALALGLLGSLALILIDRRTTLSALVALQTSLLIRIGGLIAAYVILHHPGAPMVPAQQAFFGSLISCLGTTLILEMFTGLRPHRLRNVSQEMARA